MDTTPIICLSCGEVHAAGNVRCPNCLRCPGCGLRIYHQTIRTCPDCDHPSAGNRIEALKIDCDPDNAKHAHLLLMRKQELETNGFETKVRWMVVFLFLYFAIFLPVFLSAMLSVKFAETNLTITLGLAGIVAMVLMILGWKRIVSGKWSYFLHEAILIDHENRPRWWSRHRKSR